MFPYITVFGKTIGLYGVCMLFGVLLTGFLAIRKYKRMGLPAEDIYIVGSITMLLALIGGNILYIAVTYPISYIVDCIRCGNFQWVGSGIVFYGGLLGGIAGALLGSCIAKCKLNDLISAIIPYIPLGHAIGRIGCLMAGCCYGFAYEGAFAVRYSNPLSDAIPNKGYFPVQLMEAICNVGICAVLLWYDKKSRCKKDVLFCYLGLYALVRFFVEMLRGDMVRGMWNGISTSQIVSIILFGSSIIRLLIKEICNNVKHRAV